MLAKQLTTLAILLLLANVEVDAQVMRATYLIESTTTLSEYHNGKGELYFNAGKSLFIHASWPGASGYDSSEGKYRRVIGDKEGMPVFTDRKSNIQVYKSIYLAQKKTPWIFEDTIPRINWSITNNEKVISGHSVLHATGAYGDRIYDAWYSPEIPVPFGPYRLGGLPGLILEAKSRDGVVNFEFAGFTANVTEHPDLKAPVEGTHVSQDGFKDWVIKHLLRIEATSTSEYQSTIGSCDTDYTIEKDRWPYIYEYKKERAEAGNK
ncbi:GLPGLI family protein [Neolewinella aurantiaca]|uniref:GLPGLI family protein n=1 Tax=Neolewinella aurantiaca TaxID=2602767 RepID=A0A5C7FTP3_9BACT|nr:GLPGLI family protein [Neolewinella aurantiaca]TXF91471.1 GLPGLI family protein [Neolewinella aurantiaca]